MRRKTEMSETEMSEGTVRVCPLGCRPDFIRRSVGVVTGILEETGVAPGAFADLRCAHGKISREQVGSTACPALLLNPEVEETLRAEPLLGGLPADLGE